MSIPQFQPEVIIDPTHNVTSHTPGRQAAEHHRPVTCTDRMMMGCPAATPATREGGQPPATRHGIERPAARLMYMPAAWHRSLAARSWGRADGQRPPVVNDGCASTSTGAQGGLGAGKPRPRAGSKRGVHKSGWRVCVEGLVPVQAIFGQVFLCRCCLV